MLKGNKVTLRPVCRADVQNLLKWINDPEVTQYLGRYMPMTEMAEEKYIESLGQVGLVSDIMLVIEAHEGEHGVPIGTVGLHRIDWKDRRGEFGIAIGDKAYWEKGCGTETAELMIKYGFEQLNLHRISSSVYDFNERSYRMHLKVGFKEEGRKRRYGFKNGSWHNMIVLGLLRKDWKAGITG